MYKKVIFSLAVLSCLAAVSFAQDLNATPAKLSADADSTLTYAVQKGNEEASATLVRYNVSNDEWAAIEKGRKTTVTFHSIFTTVTFTGEYERENEKSVQGVSYVYNGQCKLAFTRQNWENAYDEVMPGGLRRMCGDIREQSLVVKKGKDSCGGSWKMKDPAKLWTHEHVDDTQFGDITLVTLGRSAQTSGRSHHRSSRRR